MSASTAISISQDRADLNGRVIAPDDAGYDEARTVFYGGIDRRPAAIVRAADAADVARVVALARETGLELAIRSGGHSIAGHSATEGGIVLDLARHEGPGDRRRGPHGLGRGGADRRRVHRSRRGARPGDAGSATPARSGSAGSRSAAASATSSASTASRSTTCSPPRS